MSKLIVALQEKNLNKGGPTNVDDFSYSEDTESENSSSDVSEEESDASRGKKKKRGEDGLWWQMGPWRRRGLGKP